MVASHGKRRRTLISSIYLNLILNRHFEEESFDSGDQPTDDNASDQGGPKKQKPKRARKSKSNQKVSHKANVRGKQGALEGIMKMPIEVFIEITKHLNPADLTSLIRTNKFFRSMLLRRPAVLIWHRAQNNVPGLPPCPTGMTEPQYAALMFSKHCTLCGANVSCKPDTMLRVRLCGSCRDTKLGTDREIGGGELRLFAYLIRSFDIKPTKSRPRHPVSYHLLEEGQEARRIRNRFLEASDFDGLAEWENDKINHLEVRYKESIALSQYIKSVESSRSLELEALKATRLRQVNEKLKALGWEDKYLDFEDSASSQSWDSLINVPKPLTERMWANLLPKLVPLLEANRDRIDEIDQALRKRGRYGKILTFIRSIEQETHPYHAITQAFELISPDFCYELDSPEGLANPFPANRVLLSWDPISDLHDNEHSLESVEEQLEQSRKQIVDRVLKWREEATNQLVEQYMLGSDGAMEMNSDLIIPGCPEAANRLSPCTRFLLRADTVFVPRSILCGSQDERDKEYGPPVQTYHFPWVIADTQSRCPNFSLDQYVRHVGIEKIVKALLKDLGMPNASYVELCLEEIRFACERCKHLPNASWESLVTHYHLHLRQWRGGQFIAHRYMTRHPVVFINTHDFEVGSGSKPLARTLSSQEVKSKFAKQLGDTGLGCLWCLICSGASLPYPCKHPSMEALEEHMRESHDVHTTLTKLIHYTEYEYLASNQTHRVSWWQKRWDDLHDSQDEANEPQVGT